MARSPAGWMIEIDILQVHAQEGGGAHVERLFRTQYQIAFPGISLYRASSCFAGAAYLRPPGTMGTSVRVLSLALGQVEARSAAAEQYFYKRWIGCHVIDHF